MSNPLVSVIIPVYNREKYIAATLQSVFDQDYRPLEVIVVDDGSTDNSAEIIRSFKEALYFFQRHKGSGPALARNLGIRHSRGELISFLDSDDIWLSAKTRLQSDFLMKNPKIGYVLCQVKNFLEAGVDQPSWINGNETNHTCSSYLPSALMAGRSLFDQIGFFDPHFALGEDTDWFFRAKEKVIPMAILPEILLHRRIHEANLMHMHEDRLWSKDNLIRIIKASLDRRRQSKVPS